MLQQSITLKKNILLVAGFFSFALTISAANPPVPELESPDDGVATIVFHPSLSWRADYEYHLTAHIQIATDQAFTQVFDSDRIHSVSNWYVPFRRLPPGEYWWRVRMEKDDGRSGEWSETRGFRIMEPEEIFVIAADSSVKEIQRVAQEASHASSALIRFEKGRYKPDLNFEDALLEWDGAENILVDGGGSHFVMSEPSAQMWRIRNSRNILIGNFSYEYDPRPHTLTRVEHIDAEKGTLEARILSGFAEERYPREVNQMFAYALDPEDRRRMHPRRPGHLYLDPHRTTKKDDKIVVYQMMHTAEFPWLKDMREGDLMIVCYRRWPLSYVQRSVDVTLYGIQTRKSEAVMFMGGGNTDMKFLGLSAESDQKMYPSPAGWVTGNDRRGPWIEGCFFEALADDGPNITANQYLVEAGKTNGELVLRTMPSWQNAAWRHGDHLVFWNPGNGRSIGKAKVVEVRTSDDELASGMQRIRVDKAVEELIFGSDPAIATHVYNYSFHNSGFVARNNRMVAGRRFGFNVKAVNALIEKNHFEDLSSSAVYLENAPTFWEGLSSRNVVVQNNIMINCGNSEDSALRRRASGVHVNLWRYPGPGGYATDWIGHHRILIRNNVIIDWESVGIAVDNVDDVTISGNTFKSRSKSGFFLDENFSIWQGEHTRNVRILSNLHRDERDHEKFVKAQLD